MELVTFYCPDCGERVVMRGTFDAVAGKQSWCKTCKKRFDLNPAAQSKPAPAGKPPTRQTSASQPAPEPEEAAAEPAADSKPAPVGQARQDRPSGPADPAEEPQATARGGPPTDKKPLVAAGIACAAVFVAALYYPGGGGSQIRTFSGHSDDVHGVAISSDGSRVVSASGDRTLRVWDPNSGTLLRKFTGHSSEVLAVAISPNGRLVASSGADKSVWIWELASGSMLRVIKPGLYSRWFVRSLAFSPDSRRLAGGGTDHIVRIWHVETEKLLDTLDGHNSTVNAVAFLPDGERIVSASGDRTLRIWDASSGRTLRTLSGHTGAVLTVACSPDGELIASGGHDQSVRVWKARSGRELRVLPHSFSVVGVRFSSGSRRIFSADRHWGLYTWDAKTGERVDQTLLEGSPTSLAVGDDMVIVGASNGKLYRVGTARRGGWLVAAIGALAIGLAVLGLWWCQLSTRDTFRGISSATGDDELALFDLLNLELLASHSPLFWATTALGIAIALVSAYLLDVGVRVTGHGFVAFLLTWSLLLGLGLRLGGLLPSLRMYQLKEQARRKLHERIPADRFAALARQWMLSRLDSPLGFSDLFTELLLHAGKDTDPNPEPVVLLPEGSDPEIPLERACYCCLATEKLAQERHAVEFKVGETETREHTFVLFVCDECRERRTAIGAANQFWFGRDAGCLSSATFLAGYPASALFFATSFSGCGASMSGWLPAGALLVLLLPRFFLVDGASDTAIESWLGVGRVTVTKQTSPPGALVTGCSASYLRAAFGVDAG